MSRPRTEGEEYLIVTVLPPMVPVASAAGLWANARPVTTNSVYTQFRVILITVTIQPPVPAGITCLHAVCSRDRRIAARFRRLGPGRSPASHQRGRYSCQL